MFSSVLVVCVGNICRSPAGERFLRARLPGLTISSAGIGALVGHAADPTASEAAAARGVSLEGHVARQFTPELGASHDLILVMEPGHRAEIIRLAPQLSGKVMLFDQWTGAKGIADPYRLSRDFHDRVIDQIASAADAWAGKLDRKTR
ncbi:arsenate reductase/protein-tyrosine-phosphatase family protein [Rhodobacter ferrooxidans]|uniref:protein-tyrosine-phosphatase n=1 Tax=Rhodobacter ferrooxidans TaxID=371731 RepID=C8S2T4_9RHOB|nr:protein-tyrosine-phosphatase [Rhodobacter sp. SW2]EEW24760.1 protein tyrosine phosphatase [Rhodobacter sp. SW2]